MELLLVTGLSGAGKSLALRRLEDLGYYCVDNLPGAMAVELMNRCKITNPPIARVAIGMDSRENAFGCHWDETVEKLRENGFVPRILFLDCREEVLFRRYNETHRRHPLAASGDLEKAIQRERALLQPLRDMATLTIDTSDLKPKEFFKTLEDRLEFSALDQMLLIFMSFGFKRGIPMDVDFVLDMRFLVNPFYEPALRPLSGLDAEVRDYVTGQPETAAFFDTAETMLRQMLPGFAAQGRQRVMVAFGCTGGRHRSVAAAEEMSRRFAAEKSISVRCVHRDLNREAEDIRSRFNLKDK